MKEKYESSYSSMNAIEIALVMFVMVLNKI